MDGAQLEYLGHKLDVLLDEQKRTNALLNQLITLAKNPMRVVTAVKS